MYAYTKGETKKRAPNSKFLFVLAALLLLASGFFFIHTQFPSFFKSDIRLEKDVEISPTESVVIYFSKPVIQRYAGWNIDVTPETAISYHWEDGNKKLVIKPDGYWLPESGYRITIAGRNYLLASFGESLDFKTVSYPELSEFYPPSGQQDVVLDIEDPIHAVFDKPIKEFSIKFVISPFKDLDYEIDDENNQINLMPKGELEKGTKYTVQIYARHKVESESRYRKIGETSFMTKTLPPPQWSSNFTTRIEEAKKFTEARIMEGKYIDINLKSQVLSIFENGSILDAYMISSGKRGMETPQGTFAISNKTPRAWSKKYGLFMPYWMALVKSGEFGIHELPEWPGGYKEGQAHLGTPVSHGCVRLGVGPAKRIYEWADIGTPVVVHY